MAMTLLFDLRSLGHKPFVQLAGEMHNMESTLIKVMLFLRVLDIWRNDTEGRSKMRIYDCVIGARHLSAGEHSSNRCFHRQAYYWIE